MSEGLDVRGGWEEVEVEEVVRVCERVGDETDEAIVVLLLRSGVLFILVMFCVACSTGWVTSVIESMWQAEVSCVGDLVSRGWARGSGEGIFT